MAYVKLELEAKVVGHRKLDILAMDAATLVKLLRGAAKRAENHDGEVVEFSDETWGKVFRPDILAAAGKELDSDTRSLLQGLKDVPRQRAGDVHNDKHLADAHGAMEREVRELDDKRGALDELWLIHNGFGEVTALTDLGEFSTALESLEKVTQKLNSFMERQPRSLVGGDMLLRAQESRDAIQSRVFELWEKAIVFVHNGTESTTLSVYDPLEETPLANLVQAVDEIEHAKATGRIERLLGDIEQHVFEPVLTLGVQQVERDGPSLILRKGECTSVFEVVDALTQAVEYFNDVFKDSLVDRIVRRFATRIKHRLQRSTLPRLFPASVGALELFEQELDFAVQFEKFLANAGWTAASHEFADWARNFTSEWVDWRTSFYLERLRVSLESVSLRLDDEATVVSEPASSQYDTPVEPEMQGGQAENVDDWDWKDDDDEPEQASLEADPEPVPEPAPEHGDDWAWDDDDDDDDDKPVTQSMTQAKRSSQPASQPASQAAMRAPSQKPGVDAKPSPTADPIKRQLAYTTAVPTVTEAINDFTAEINQLGRPSEFPVGQLVTLYRALSPLAYEPLPSDVVVYSDYMRVANWLLDHGHKELSEKLQMSAERALRSVVAKRQKQVSGRLAVGGGTMGPVARFDAYRTAVGASLELLDGLVAECDDYVPLAARQQVVGAVVETLCATILRHIQALPDIAERDSERLASLIEDLSAAEKWFPVDQPEPAAGNDAVTTAIAAFVPSWIKLQYLHEILQSNLTDIQFLFDEGALVDFTASELTSLIQALFADSEHSRNAIAHIRDSSPH